MKKKIVALSLTVVMLTALSACSKPASSSSVSSEVVSSESLPASSSSASSSSSSTASSSESTSKATVVDADGLPETMGLPIMIKLDGVVYSLPGSSITDLLDNGWTVESSLEDAVLPARTGSWGYMNKGNAKISFSYENNNEAAAPFRECTLTKIEFYESDLEKGNVDWVLPGNITKDSTVEELEAAYGEPTEISLPKEGSTLNYRADSYKGDGYEYKLHFSDGVISSVSLRGVNR